MSTKFVFFWPIGKTRWPPWPLIGWDIVVFDLLWNRWTEFNKNWLEARSQRPLPSLCFSGWSEKQDGRPGRWFAETFSTSSLKPLNGIHRNLWGSKISTSSTKFVFFWLIGKTRWPPWPLICWDIFDFSSETTELNSTKLDRKQDLKVLYQVCIFGPISKQKKNSRPGRFLKKVAHCTLVPDMWPCGPLVFGRDNWDDHGPVRVYSIIVSMTTVL